MHLNEKTPAYFGKIQSNIFYWATRVTGTLIVKVFSQVPRPINR
jgi:hypothetical protein